MGVAECDPSCDFNKENHKDFTRSTTGKKFKKKSQRKKLNNPQTLNSELQIRNLPPCGLSDGG